MGLIGGRMLFLAAALAGYAAVRRAQRQRWLYDLHGRTVLVTGGSRGLGLALARALAAEGARVAICGRDPAALERAREQLEHLGAEALAVPCDVTDPAQVADLVRIVTEWFGPPDVVINNAGTIAVGPEQTMTLADYEEQLRSNFWGAVHVTRAVLPAMRRRPGGRIVNIASIGGKLAMPHLLPYSAAKFATVGFSRALRAELAPHGVFVTTVSPGLMRTGSPRNADFKGKHRAEYAWFSIADALPGLSIDADHAAARILAACRRGDAELTFPLTARAAELAQTLAPGLAAEALGVVAALLPRAEGSSHERTKGRESESVFSPSFLTRLNDRAAARLNQTADGGAAVPAPSSPHNSED